jgi:quercetin dioxygenase-like cupin family protein
MAVLVIGSGQLSAETLTQGLLDVRFEPRKIEVIEVGDFHFTPGQVAPVHTHVAPAIGYVAKGTIIYQIAGFKPQILTEGDAFYEPAGPDIVRFDNASASEEAIFIDYNFQQPGEPFIRFKTPPTEAIDRRALSPVNLNGALVSKVTVFASEIDAGAELVLGRDAGHFGYVAEGAVDLIWDGAAPKRVIAGQSFSLPPVSEVLVVNASSEVAAKLVTLTAN